MLGLHFWVAILGRTVGVLDWTFGSGARNTRDKRSDIRDFVNKNDVGKCKDASLHL